MTGAENRGGGRRLTVTEDRRVQAGGDAAPAKDHGIRARVIVLSIPLIVLNAFWLFANWGTSGYDSGQSFATIISLFYNVIFCIVVLLSANSLLRRYLPRHALSSSELMALYVLLTIGSVMAGHDSTQILWPMIAYPAWFASPANGWGRFQRYMPDALTVKNRAVLKDYFLGGSTLYTWEHISIWLLPVFLWTVIIVIMTLMMLCILALLADRWTRQERLAYPNTQLPLAMIQEGGTFFKSPWMWIGLAIAAGMNLMNGLHLLYPSLPGSGGAFLDLGTLLRSRPWSAIGYTPTAVFPFAVGMSFFIPLDLSFSIWFFYVVTKLSRVAGDVFGFTANPRFPYPIEQSAGAWIGLVLLALWASRNALREQFQRALHGDKQSEGDVLAPRTAVMGLVAGSLVLMVMARMVGIPPLLSAIYLLLFFAIGIGIARIRAELGPPSHDFLGDPLMMMTTFAGSSQLGMPVLTVFMLMNSLNRAYRAHPMPTMLEGFAMFIRRGLSSRRLLFGIVLAVIVGTLSSAWAHYFFSYKYGAAVYGEQAQCWWFYDRLAGWGTNPARPDGPGITAMLSGAAITFGLMALRLRYPWCPLHPAGYALSLSPWNAAWYSTSVFVGWLIKLAIMHYGGLRLYRRALPFFMGLVLGDLMMGAIWSLLGIILKMHMFRFLL